MAEDKRLLLECGHSLLHPDPPWEYQVEIGSVTTCAACGGRLRKVLSVEVVQADVEVVLPETDQPVKTPPAEPPAAATELPRQAQRHTPVAR